MPIQKISVIIFFLLIFAGSSLATTGVPDPWTSFAYMPGITNETVFLFSNPNGQGIPLNAAQIYNDGSIVDATIVLELRDAYGSPIPHFPLEDIWLESMDGNMAPCIAGTCPDTGTDNQGITMWTTTLRAGGYSRSGCYVMVNGMPVQQPPFALYFNSADVNGDGIVNLNDLGLFATSFFHEFSYSVDFYNDGVLNLVDVGRFASAYGSACQ